MKQLREILERLPPRHRMALQWFAAHAGSEQGWPEPLRSSEGETFLVIRRKGIYKPEWLPYALSVRESIGGKYPDEPPIVRPDRTWLYRYFQENENPSARDEEYTNRALMNCWRDGVPIGVVRQLSPKPKRRYLILGLALVAGWDGGYFILEGFSPSGRAREADHPGELEVLSHAGLATLAESGFDPNTIVDAREKIKTQILRRRGQPEFRWQLLRAYEVRCAVSGCDAVAALEAAHIIPYRGPTTNRVENGLLLRADIHTLFDLGLMAVDPKTTRILLSPALKSTTYRDLQGSTLRLPRSPEDHPSPEALAIHRRIAGL